MPKLGVNIDHIATLRQQRCIGVPDLLHTAKIALSAGAESITVHLREDRRHIQDSDVYALRKIKGLYLNLEMAAVPEIEKIALKVKPDSVCIVPEKRKELTTEGGLDVEGNKNSLSKMIKRLKKENILVTMFVDPSVKQIIASYNAGADAVEIHTGAYADARTPVLRKKEFEKVKYASAMASDLGLLLHAGHGLDYSNVRPIAGIDGMSELNIGFAIICSALETGLFEAVRSMKKLCA